MALFSALCEIIRLFAVVILEQARLAVFPRLATFIFSNLCSHLSFGQDLKDLFNEAEFISHTMVLDC
jgi:hypothetical protein